MFRYITNKLKAITLKAQYQRRMQERLLHFVEATNNAPCAVPEDPGQWIRVGNSEEMTEPQQRDLRGRARQLVMENPYAAQILRLLETYVVGPQFRLVHLCCVPEADVRLAEKADELWDEFLRLNHRHFSYREFARRVWRDGEAFLRVFESDDLLPGVRFLDPESIGSTNEHPDSRGILTSPEDVERPTAYLVASAEGEEHETIPAEEMLHTRHCADSNQKRGVSLFAPLIGTLDRFDEWKQIELTARKLQAAVVLWRKVSGSPSAAASFCDDSEVERLEPGPVETSRPRFQPGSILTTSMSTDLSFLTPQTNYRDAVPLGRLMLLSLSAGAGLPEFMVTSDASNANYSSTMVAEGPAVKRFEAEQAFFAGELDCLWRMVMQSAVATGLLPADFFDRIETRWSFPTIVNRDRNKDRLADVRLVQQGILSRSEVARRDGVDPDQMQEELREEDLRSRRDRSE